jgi:hypothetical protein
MGGTPVIIGTRVPLATLLDHLGYHMNLYKLCAVSRVGRAQLARARCDTRPGWRSIDRSLRPSGTHRPCGQDQRPCRLQVGTGAEGAPSMRAMKVRPAYRDPMPCVCVMMSHQTVASACDDLPQRDERFWRVIGGLCDVMRPQAYRPVSDRGRVRTALRVGRPWTSCSH